MRCNSHDTTPAIVALRCFFLVICFSGSFRTDCCLSSATVLFVPPVVSGGFVVATVGVALLNACSLHSMFCFAWLHTPLLQSLHCGVSSWLFGVSSSHLFVDVFIDSCSSFHTLRGIIVCSASSRQLSVLHCWPFGPRSPHAIATKGPISIGLQRLPHAGLGRWHGMESLLCHWRCGLFSLSPLSVWLVLHRST
jgi:hypothetical protein